MDGDSNASSAWMTWIASAHVRLRSFGVAASPVTRHFLPRASLVRMTALLGYARVSIGERELALQHDAV